MRHFLDSSQWFRHKAFWATHLYDGYAGLYVEDGGTEECDGFALGKQVLGIGDEELNRFFVEDMQLLTLHGDWPEFVLPLPQAFSLLIRYIGETGDRQTSHEIRYLLQDDRNNEHFLGQYSGNHYLPALRWVEIKKFSHCTSHPDQALLLLLPSIYLHPTEMEEATQDIEQAFLKLGMKHAAIHRLAVRICQSITCTHLRWDCDPELGWVCTTVPCARARLPETNDYVSKGYLVHHLMPPAAAELAMFAAMKKISQLCGIPHPAQGNCGERDNCGNLSPTSHG